MHPHVETKGSIKTIPLITQLLRESANAITSPSLKISTYDTSGGLSKAEQLLEQDYGLIVVANHFSKGDPPRIIKFIFDNPQLQKRRILLPEAIHQYREWHNIVGGLLGVLVCPITTEDTIKYISNKPGQKPKYENALSARGSAKTLKNYFDEACAVLKEGGIVVVFPQGGRRPFLEKVTSAISALLKRTDNANINPAFMFMGIGIDGILNYADKKIANSMNLGTRYLLQIGRTLTRTELSIETGHQRITIDDFVVKELQPLVPPGYLPKKF